MPNDNLELALRIRADLKSAVNQLKQFNEQLDAGANSAHRAGAAQSQVRGVDLTRSTRTAQRYDSALDEINRTTVQLQSNNQRLSASNQQLNTTYNRLAATVRAYGLTLAAGFSAREILGNMDAWTAFQNRLRLVTDTQNELATATQDVYQIARQTSQQINSTAEVYQRFAQNAQTLNLSQAQTAQLTRTVTQSIAIGGQSAESSEAALVQFGQALASGVLRGEEFNSVMEQAPALARALASGLGVNIGVLRVMANQGQLTSDVLVRALTNAADSVTKQFETRVRTIGQAATELNSAFTRMLGVVSTNSGFGAGLASGISAIADALDDLSDHADLVGDAMEVALVMTAGRVITALTNMSAASLRNVVVQRTQAISAANVAAGNERAAVAAQANATAELESSRASVTAATADVRAAEALVAKTRAAADASVGLTTHTALSLRATEATTALAAAQARLDAALDARTVATERAAASTATLTAATNANAVAAERARVANSLFLGAFSGIRAAGSRVLAMMGGPMGLVITAGLMATAFMDFGHDAKTAMDDVKDSVDDLQTPLDQVIPKMEKLSNAERQQALAKMSTAFETLTQNAQDSARELATTTRMMADPGTVGPAGEMSQRSEATQKQLRAISTEAQKMADGTGGSFDELSEQLRNNTELSDEARSKLLGFMAAVEKTRREASALSDRVKELNNAFNDNANATESVAQANARMQFERINAELDREAERLVKVGDALTVQERLDRITNQLERSKITLSDQQTESIRNRLQQIVAQQRVQSEMNRIYQDSIGLEQNWAATQRAAQRLLDSGVISRTQYNRELTAGQEQYLNQLDPLRQINAQLSDQIRLLHLQPQARQLESRMLSIQNQLLQQGIDLRKDTATRSAVYAKLRQAQALQDVETLRNLNTEYLRMSGDNVGAQTAQLEQQYGELMQRLAADGNAAGQQFMKRFFSLSNAQAQLEQVRTTISNAMSRSDTSGRVLDLQVENGTATELERRQKLLQIHQQTYEVLEKQRPLLEQLSQQPGQVGEAAQQVLANLQIQELQLQQTTSRLTESLKSGLQSGLGDAISGLAKGTDSLADSVRNLVNSIIDSISQLVAQSLTNQFMNSATGTAISTGLTSLFGFASGGYTGAGARNDVAGVVHAGEYVQPQSVMKQPGAMAFQEAFRREGMAAISRFRGYADGGAVTGSNLQMTRPAGSTVENAVNLYAMQDPAAIADMAWGRQGQQNYMVFLGKNKNQIKQILGVK